MKTNPIWILLKIWKFEKKTSTIFVIVRGTGGKYSTSSVTCAPVWTQFYKDRGNVLPKLVNKYTRHLRKCHECG